MQQFVSHQWIFSKETNRLLTLGITFFNGIMWNPKKGTAQIFRSKIETPSRNFGSTIILDYWNWDKRDHEDEKWAIVLHVVMTSKWILNLNLLLLLILEIPCLFWYKNKQTFINNRQNLAGRLFGVVSSVFVEIEKSNILLSCECW